MKIFAILPLLAIIAAPFFAPGASAHPLPEDKPKPAISMKDITLPSKAEIETMKESLPDMNVMMGSMMKMMKDEDFRAGMDKTADVMKRKMGALDMKSNKDGMPDMNAMMGAMLELFGDEEMMESLIGQIAPLQEMMEEALPEAAMKPKPAKPLPKIPDLPK
ncbi:MAG: hypothetical protein V3U82_03820 [Robiginitomaculum sp.]